MDTSDFILKRQELQRNLDIRRAEIEQRAYSARSSMIPWILITGASVVTGLRSSSAVRRLVRTIAWATIAPMVIGLINRHDQGFLHRILETIFPFSQSKEKAVK